MKIDPWALFELHDRYDLTPIQSWLLVILVLHADWKRRVWEGSRGELAALASGLSTNTVRPATNRLVHLKLIDELQPFRPNGRGRLHVACYDQVVVPNQTTSRAEQRDLHRDGTGARAEIQHEPRSDRAPSAQTSASDQGKQGLARSEAVRSSEEGAHELGEQSGAPLADEDGLALIAAQADADEWDPDAPPPWLTPNRVGEV